MRSFSSGNSVYLYCQEGKKDASVRSGDTYIVRFGEKDYKVTAYLIAAQVDWHNPQMMVALGNTAILTKDYVYTQDYYEREGKAGGYYVPDGMPPFLFAQTVSSYTEGLPNPCTENYEGSGRESALCGSGEFYYLFAEGVDYDLAQSVEITPVIRAVSPIDETLLPPVYSEYFQCGLSIPEAFTFITQWLSQLQARVDGNEKEKVQNISHFFFDHSDAKEGED